MWVIIRSGDISQCSRCDQAANGDIGFSYNLLLSVKMKAVWIGGKIQLDGICVNGHADIRSNHLVVEVLFLVGLILIHGGSISHMKGFPYIFFDIVLVRFHGKEELMKPFDMIPGFCIAVLGDILP